MKEHSEIAIFEEKNIRRQWSEKEEKWYFSVVDIVGALTGSIEPRKYWNKLAERLRNEGSEVVTKCHQLKLTAEDGKMRLTDVADTEVLFRLIQSVPSPKAEPIKLWLAKVGYERVQDISDPERSINRGREYWQKMGRSEEWIQRRMMGQETRNKLTDYWKTHEVSKAKEYAILTNIIHEEWSDLTVKQHKELKGLKQQNLRDHMDEAELIFTALAEMSTRQIAEVEKATGFEENKTPAHKGGRIAKNARLELEEKTGKKVVNGQNFLGAKIQKRIK
jgi:DNA-damage-inducible protein D